MKRKHERAISDTTDIGNRGPQPGDVLVGCIHKPDPNGAHYFYTGNDKGIGVLHVTHPITNEEHMAKWILLCDECLIKFGDRIHDAVEKNEVPLANIATWRKEDGQVVFISS
jgi:hypothetical protein